MSGLSQECRVDSLQSRRLGIARIASTYELALTQRTRSSERAGRTAPFTRRSDNEPCPAASRVYRWTGKGGSLPAGSSPSASRIFISYRRENAAYVVGRLAHDLRQHFPDDQVFQNITSIDPSADFVKALQHGLDTCATMLVVIDPKWLTVTDRQGQRRLDLPDDWVRHEVAESLRRPD